MDDGELIKRANRALDYRYAKGWEYWKKRNPNLSEEELENKVEEYVNRHPETTKIVDCIIEKSFNDLNNMKK